MYSLDNPHSKRNHHLPPPPAATSSSIVGTIDHKDTLAVRGTVVIAIIVVADVQALVMRMICVSMNGHVIVVLLIGRFRHPHWS